MLIGAAAVIVVGWAGFHVGKYLERRKSEAPKDEPRK